MFSETIKKHLKDKNLSHVARELGIPKTVLHEWVNASRNPSLKNIGHIKKLADYLSLSLNELLIGEDSTTLLSSFTFEDGDKKYRIKIERI